MAKKWLHFANRYWGDILWFLSLPFHIYFYCLVIKNPVDPHDEILGLETSTLPVSRHFIWVWLGFYLAFTIVSAFRVLFRKKHSLRDFHYLIIGAIAAYCFVGFILPWIAPSPYLSQSHFLDGAKFLQQINTTFLTARASIWLYKWYERGEAESALAREQGKKEETEELS